MFSRIPKFDGSFDSNSQISSLPQTLLPLVNMLLEGPGNAKHCSNQAALSLAQLIVFNSIKRPRKRSVSETAAIEEPASVRHLIARETPHPIYVVLMLHSATLKKTC